MKKWFKNLDWSQIGSYLLEQLVTLLFILAKLFLYGGLFMYAFNSTGISDYLGENVTYWEAVSFVLCFGILIDSSNARANNKN